MRWTQVRADFLLAIGNQAIGTTYTVQSKTSESRHEWGSA